MGILKTGTEQYIKDKLIYMTAQNARVAILEKTSGSLSKRLYNTVLGDFGQRVEIDIYTKPSKAI